MLIAARHERDWGSAVLGEPTSQIGDHPTVTPPSSWNKSTFRGLRAIIAEDRTVNGRSWLNPATQMLVHHRLGEWVFAQQRSAVTRRIGHFIYRVLYAYVRNVLGFEVPPTTVIGRKVKFVHQHGVTIHPHAQIGDGCKIHQGVTIGLRSDPDATGVYPPPPRLGTGVQLGVGAAVIGPVNIGDHATIGPNAVVTRDVPSGASVVAPPSRVLRLR
jgi:serine O-acetyltransferase